MKFKTTECQFRDIATFHYGKMPKKDKVLEMGKYPIYSGYRYVGYYDEYNVDAGTLIVVARGVGGTGDVKITKEKCYLTNLSIAVEITNRNKVLPEYLYYQYRLSNLRYLDSGSAQSQITISDLEKVSIQLPDVAVQSKIVDILSSIDRKIDVNIEINKNLEEQAQTIFDSFYEQADNEVPFTSLIQILGGGTPKTKVESYWNGDIPFFTPKDVGNPYTLSTEKTITPTGLEHCNSRLYPINTTFVTARGTVGKVSLAGAPMAMNQSCYALSGNNIHPLMTYFYTLKTIQSLRHKASGAVFDAIVTSDFKSEILRCISENDSMQLLNSIEPMMDRILQGSVENTRLAQLRDTLLPRLMSGEIDVSKIEV